MTCRFRILAPVALCLIFPPFCLLSFLATVGSVQPVQPLFRIVHPFYLIIILTLRWLFETPLETLQEVARLGNGRWARKMAALKPQPQEQAEPVGDIDLGDFDFYVRTGNCICAALTQWTFWLWLVFPVQYFFVTIPPAMAGAVYVWQTRMSFLGPSYEFACDREIEDREDAMTNV